MARLEDKRSFSIQTVLMSTTVLLDRHQLRLTFNTSYMASGAHAIRQVTKIHSHKQASVETRTINYNGEFHKLALSTPNLQPRC